MGGCCRSAEVLSLFFEYDTPRIVHIRSKRIGIANRILQLCVIAYIIGYAIVYTKGYQETASVEGAISTKVKGVSFAPETIAGNFPGVWDVADYVVPPQENNAFFVTTNVLITHNQTQTTCLQSPHNQASRCSSDAECPANETSQDGNGILTGKCKNYLATNIKTCEMYAWCPLENDSINSSSLLSSAENFTVFIKNNIEFPKFNVRRSNVPRNSTVSGCTYNPSVSNYCPIFRLGSIAEATREKFADLSLQGAIIQIIIQWNCNLDYGEENCLPKYIFRRLDVNSNLSKGFNFRYAHYYSSQNGVTKRTLIKAYGIHFLLTLEGTAGKFSIVPLLLNVGSGLALLSVATIICDILLLYIVKAKHFYREKKYLTVAGDDQYLSFANGETGNKSETRSDKSEADGAKDLNWYE